MAISSRAAACAALAFPSTAAAAAPPSSVSVNRRARPRKALAAVARATSAGGAVLDPPAFDQSQLDTLPPAQEGGDTGRLKDRKGTGSGDSYKVLLLDDPRHTEKHVETALPQVVPSVTPEAARQLFHESRQKGAALVIVAVKEHAEFYAQMMVRHGLRSAIEPESDMAA
ncbi:hypothetical protein CFC21_036819 [Triticum aestivum]|uniref:Adaptor protein ClpS core domain-containing protein n=4 Tax=Triticum TaxID=4564 RepID=A0A9R0VNG9_TRITD|nr:ATP-dependent Clp protease adapter protein CLPS2, chloroplastic-like [Triticum dicoccoides]XP_044341974.1 ATP-dependent Clp protease adapter protein CLPS2, chloroplastic-like [Triticum aestivum]XP_048565054.1 ATP-dependent Clp protease adapter protein CLPS2, chloroplastic-like [Triticum urartu]KAF7024473.1 hypothetical protein CFC21_036819 [Triticum aestivum]VAH65640.1 unnamed protein product [Triticum turgidum subsp. durum]